MSKLQFFKLKTTLMAAAILALTGCFHDDDGGGATAKLPANATTLADGATVDAVATEVITGDDFNDFDAAFAAAFGGIGGLAVDSGRPLQSMANTILNHAQSNGIETRAVQSASGTVPCTGGGSISVSISIDDVTFLGSISATFKNCVENGTTINGNFKFKDSESATTYTETGSVNITLDTGVDTLKLVVSGAVYTEDLASGDWTDTFDYSVENSTHAYLVEVTTPITGLGSEFCANGGVLLISGGGGTRIQITIVSTTEYQVSADTNGDGTFDVVGANQPGCF